MAIEHLYGIEFKDVPNNNQYIGAGLFRKTMNGFENYANIQGTNVRFPVEFHSKGVFFEATYPDGTTDFVNYRIFNEFDFDPDSQWY